MQLHPYLSFTGCAQEAIDLYAKALNGQIEHVETYAKHTEMLKTLPAGWDNKVMHVSMRAGEIVIMASDVVVGNEGPCALKEINYAASPISLSINCSSVEELVKTFNVLAECGEVTMPPQDTFWGAHFAMLVDKFGIKWMLNFDYPQK